MSNQEANEVLQYWFGGGDRSKRPRWFGGKEQTTQEIRDRFGGLVRDTLYGALITSFEQSYPRTPPDL